MFTVKMVLDLGMTGNDFANADRLFYPRKHTCQTQFKVKHARILMLCPMSGMLGEANTSPY